jgi:hypothetical protein
VADRTFLRLLVDIRHGVGGFAARAGLLEIHAVLCRAPVWVEAICAEGNQHVRIGKENYMLSADGYLMPAKKDQPPPDLRYFNKAQQ